MALDAGSGRLLFNFDAKAYVFSSGALAGGLIYFGAHNGRVLEAHDVDVRVRAGEFVECLLLACAFENGVNTKRLKFLNLCGDILF